MTYPGETALLRLVETMSAQIGALTREVGEMKGMLKAWELDRERIDDLKEELHRTQSQLAANITRNAGEIETLKTRQWTTAIAIIIVIVLTFGGEFPKIPFPL